MPPREPRSSRIPAVLGGILASAALTLLLLEVALRAAAWSGLATPSERITDLADSFYRDENPAFGVWHPPDATYVARADCFEVEYASNSWGARDRPRSLQSAEPRVVVLGDSFVEGIGVPFGRRMTDLLEAWTDLEHLNFGTAGNFSSIQQWKLYETLASDFDHDRVFVFHFPNNDFTENDPERFWQEDRYRPYLRETAAGHEVYYPISLEEARRRAKEQLWWNRWYNAVYVYRLVAFLDAQIRVRLAQGETTEFGYIGYEQFTEEDLERLFVSYRHIRDLAGGREVVVFSIPRLNDLLYHEAKGYPRRLPDRLRTFADAEEGIRYHDLMPGFIADREAHDRRLADYFLPCDGHWNALGSRVAAEIVLDRQRSWYAARGAGLPGSK